MTSIRFVVFGFLYNSEFYVHFFKKYLDLLAVIFHRKQDANEIINCGITTGLNHGTIFVNRSEKQSERWTLCPTQPDRCDSMRPGAKKDRLTVTILGKPFVEWRLFGAVEVVDDEARPRGGCGRRPMLE